MLLRCLDRVKVKGKNEPVTIYELYPERIAALQSQGIGDDWDGVFEHTSK